MFRPTVLVLSLAAVFAVPFPAKNPRITPVKEIESRIVNGETAAVGQFPWQALLYITGDDYNWLCGGTIISERWILTAGHCVDGGTSGIVFTGSVNLLDGNSNIPTDFILHEEYDEQNLKNDIGLIGLAIPLRFNENTAPVALSEDPLDEGVEITASGWGVYDETNALSEILKFVTLTTISNSVCNATFGVIRDEMVCAESNTDEVKSTCSGDSGGPVVINADADPVLVAISSFVGAQGCESGTPSGYTRVSPYRKWIQDNTGV